MKSDRDPLYQAGTTTSTVAILLLFEQSIVFDSVSGLYAFSGRLKLRMRKISLSRGRQVKWDSNSVSLPSEAIAMTTNYKQEIIKLREVIPHTGPLPIVIPLRLFLDDINFPADVTARVTWKFRGGGKVQQITLYDATLRFQN